MKVILAAHVVWDKGFENNGPAHIVARYLESKGFPFYFLKFPLYENHRAEVKTPSGETLELKRTLRPLRHLTNVVTTIRFVLTLKDRKLVFIGVDPLNAFSGWLLKKLGKIRIFVFHTPDYSPKKFDNPILNYIYHTIDRFCAKRADFVWGVSQRIIEKRKAQGVDERKIFWIPNSPPRPLTTCKKSADPERPCVVSLSYLISTQKILPILKAVRKISQSYPKVKLLLIGPWNNDPDVSYAINDLGIRKNVEFTGWLPYEEAIETVKRASIGLAFYTDEVSWTYYCDPVKVRDYLACGLPVIMNDVPGVSVEIETFKAGKVVGGSPDEIADAILWILGDDKLYEQCSQNALSLAKEHSSEKYLEQTFEAIEVLQKNTK